MRLPQQLSHRRAGQLAGFPRQVRLVVVARCEGRTGIRKLLPMQDTGQQAMPPRDALHLFGCHAQHCAATALELALAEPKCSGSLNALVADSPAQLLQRVGSCPLNSLRSTRQHPPQAGLQRLQPHRIAARLLQCMVQARRLACPRQLGPRQRRVHQCAGADAEDSCGRVGLQHQSQRMKWLVVHMNGCASGYRMEAYCR